MSFRVIRQRDAADCGIACLRMICRHFGKELSQAEAEELCCATAEGVSMMAIKQSAEAIGLNSMCGRVATDSLADMPLPCVLHWNQSHFVVLYKCTTSRFYLADPAKGRVALTRDDFESHWIASVSQGEKKGIAIFFEPGERFANDVSTRREHNSRIKVIGQCLKEYKHQFAVIFFGLLLTCLLQLALPFLTQWIVDFGIQHRDIKLIWLILLGELMIVAGRTASDFVRRWVLMHMSMRVNMRLVSDFLLKLMRLPMAFFDTKHTGDLLQRMNDHQRVESFLTNEVLSITMSALTFLVFGIVLFAYDHTVFFVFIGGSMAYGLWIALFLHRRKLLDFDLFEQLSINQSRTFQLVTSMQEIKLQGCEGRRHDEWEDSQAGLYDVRMKSLKLQQTQEAGSIFITEIKNALITVIAATAVIDGQLSLGAMLAIQYIVGQLNSPVEQIMKFVYTLQDVMLSLERIGEIHERHDEEDRCLGEKRYADDKSIVLDHVDFKYDRYAPHMTIDGVSIMVPAGKVTAIVGASGSGKTTLVKLMLGYYPLLSGKIAVAGRDIGDYSPKWWRGRCGAVMQEGVIFTETIARNIAVGDEKIDLNRLERSARIACIHDYVDGLPMKYDTKIGRDGIALSQGQRQRILIARAVYKDPDFIFLDEATNSLDANNERAIVENLEKFYRGRTVVIVAHRLSTVKNADQIIVLDKGRVVESGTHATLVANRDAYYNLVKNQLELGS